jgi:protocatechuate 3,4-dioxygenase beta subunit
MMKTIATIVFATLILSRCGQLNNKSSSTKANTDSALLSRKIIISDGCDGCDLMYEGMPSPGKLNWTTSVANASEPGERMEISGAIYKADGTPAPGIVLYVYHTDAKGYYSPGKDQKDGKRHGHLRGWMITNNKGEYKFTTIRPAPYPKADIPAHIHPIIKEPNKIEYYIDEFLFADDPKLTTQEKSKQQNRGGSGIVNILKNEKGIWVAQRKITLGLNIPNYK